MKKSQVSQLWEQYLEVKFRWFDKATALSSFVILTAYNPRSQIQQQIINRIKQQKLSTYLLGNKIPFTPILCGNADFSYCEPSIAVDLDEKKAVNLASIYDQNAIYVVREGELYLVPVLLKNMPTQKMGLLNHYLTS